MRTPSMPVAVASAAKTGPYEEVLRVLAKRRGLAQLLGDPGISRMARDAHMHHPAGGQFYHEECVEWPESMSVMREASHVSPDPSKSAWCA